jgi:hypothetical protein
MAQPVYTQELERIITEVLLPVFEQHVEKRGYPIMQTEIPPAYLAKFKTKKILPRLLMPKEKLDLNQ